MSKGWSIADKVILITGAARGIGAAVARGLHDAGARVALVGLEPDLLRKAAGDMGSRAMWAEADVTDSKALDRAVAAVVAKFGGIDGLFLNAGIGTFGTCATIDPAHFERVIEVNFLGAWRALRAALAHVIERRGYILFNASVAAALAVPGLAHYCASKAAVEALGDSLRVETRHQGVSVGVAYLGWVDTDLVQTAQADGLEGLWDKMPGALKNKTPVPVAAAALVRAFERRDERVMVPRALRAILPLRWAINMLSSKMSFVGQEVERAAVALVQRVGDPSKVPTSEPPRPGA